MIDSEALGRIQYAIIETADPWWDSAKAVKDVRDLLKSYEKQRQHIESIHALLEASPHDPILGEKINAILSR